MYKNFFTFDVYKENNDKLLEVKTLEELTEVEDESIVLPKTCYQKNEYILGDLLLNESNNELILFSCYTYKNAINKVGFFVFKNYRLFELFSSINLNEANCFDLSKQFQFKKINEIQINKFKKIGNILLLKNEFFFNELSKYFSFIKNNNLFNNLKNILRKINDFQTLVSDGIRLHNHVYMYSKFLKKTIVSCENLNFYPKLTLVGSSFNIGGYNCQIFSSKDNIKKDTNYMIYFDLNSFETYISDIENKELICEDLILNKSSYNIYFPCERHRLRANKYDNAFLKVISCI